MNWSSDSPAGSIEAVEICSEAIDTDAEADGSSKAELSNDVEAAA